VIRRLGFLLLLALLVSAPASQASDKAEPTQECVNRQLLGYLEAISALERVVAKPTVGVEVEGYLPSHEDWLPGEARARFTSQMHDAIFSALPKGTRVKSEQMKKNESGLYNFTYTYEVEGRTHAWKLIGDSSLDSSADWEGSEVISPILDLSPGSPDLEIYTSVMHELKYQGFKADPQSAGTHVHVGMPEPQVLELGVIARLFSQIQFDVFRYFGPRPGRSLYARPVPQDFLKSLHPLVMHTRNVEVFLEAYASSSTRTARHHALNLHALKRHGTVEFRMFNSTLDVAGLDLMIGFSHRLVHAVRNSDPKLMAYLESLEGQGADLFGVSKAIGIDLGKHRDVLKKLGTEFSKGIDFQGELNSGSVVALLIAGFILEQWIHGAGLPAAG
jgi:hypothetical protein